MNTPTVTLNNNVEMPVLGLGVYLIEPGPETERAVSWALETGYRHIDTAAAYQNEASVGKALMESGIPREEVFIATKLRNRDQGRAAVRGAFERSLDRLGVEYVDLYLIHWPVQGLRQESWEVVQELGEEGRARAIGVSNYTIGHLEELFSQSATIPAVNQVEFHPLLFQRDLLDFCRRHAVQLEAYSPLARGRAVRDPVVEGVAREKGRTPAQILIRWSIQHGLLTIPKSSHQERIRENFRVFDFELSPDEMTRLDSLDRSLRVAWDPTGVA